MIVATQFAVSKNAKAFKVGNMIGGFRDDVEVEGEILVINHQNNTALIRSTYGDVTVSLEGARWL
jgi:hypothetical protein